MRCAISRPRRRSRVQTLAFSPYSESLACRDGVFHVVEAVDRDHRPEGFLAVELHLRRHVGQDRRLEEVRADLGPRLTAGQHGRALADRILDVRA